MFKKIILALLIIPAASCALKIRNIDARENIGGGTLNYKPGVITELKIKEEILFEDGLSITLTGFSHKRPHTNGPTKATASLTLLKDDISDMLLLSIHGLAGKSAAEDGLSETERYDTKQWNEYEFKLKYFNYDKSIGVIIKKTN